MGPISSRWSHRVMIVIMECQKCIVDVVGMMSGRFCTAHASLLLVGGLWDLVGKTAKVPCHDLKESIGF